MSEQEQNITPENLDDNSCSATQWETMKKEVLDAVDEKFDVEAVAQMVEQLEFSKKLNGSLQAELQRRDQMIQFLQGRLNNLELDIALLKRTVVSPYPFPAIPAMNQKPVSHQPCRMTESVQTQPAQSDQTMKPPDFSKLRAMTVAEPVNKFVPPPKPGQGTEST